MKTQDFVIKRTSIFDMGKIIKMAFFYHKDDPLYKQILANPFKSLFYKIFGPLYLRWTLTSFKAVVDEEIVGYVLVKNREFSAHIWDLVVDQKMRGRGIGKKLMDYAEESVKNKYEYVSLAVMEDNLPAIHLYKKLGYENLLFSPVCYSVEKARSWKNDSLVKFEQISGEEVIRCRKEHFFNVLNKSIGQSKGEIVNRCYPLTTKPGRHNDYFKILAADDEVGYLSISGRKGTLSVFVIVNPKKWNTDTEERIIMNVIEYGFLTADQLKFCVLQAYERNLERLLKRLNFVVEREIPRLALIKSMKE
ncbi:MAG: GNAT family N-acetyltransferase [Promethearchaeota archaeon]